MRSQSVLAACGLAALVCASAMAQSAAPAPAPSQQKPQQQGGLAPGAPPLQLQNLPSEQHTLTPAEQEQIKRAQAYRTAMRIANLTARWGPAMSTPGVSVTLVQTARAKTASGATQFTYQVAGTGFRAGEKLNLVRWPLGEDVRAEMSGLVLNPQGIAICGSAAKAAPSSGSASPAQAPTPNFNPSSAPQPGSAPPPPAGAPSCGETMKPNQPVEIQATAAPGEAIRVALIGEDRSNGAATQTVPFPLTDTDKSCSLQVLLGMKDADMVVVEGNGLPANSTVKIETTTGGQTRALNAKTNPAGHMAIVVLPGVGGQTAGITTVRYAGVIAATNAAPTAGNPSLTAPAATAAAAATDTGCAPAVSFHWGAASYKAE